jgi:DNA polymerase-4
MNKIILHSDVNNFYASVALKLNPELKGKPVIVCGDPDRRHGIVLAKSNIAKKAGIKTGDTLFEARRKCPSLIAVPPDYKQYMKFSNIMYNIYIEYTPYVQSFGLDECWLDVTGCEKEYGSGENLANIIRERVKKEIGVTISIGVSYTKIFAKLGSDYKKPDAVTVIDKNNYKDIVWNLKVEEMLFIGRSTKQKLSKVGIFKIGDLATTPKVKLKEMLGKVGEKLYDAANGIEDDDVDPYNIYELPESVSNGSTTEQDICDLESATALIYSLSEVIAFRLRKFGLFAGGVSLTARDCNLNSFTRQEMIVSFTSNAKDIAETALGILKKHYSFSENLPLRMITVGTYKLIEKDSFAQSSIFDDENEKESIIDEKIDKLRNRYGYGILKRGIEMNETFSCDAREIDDGFLPFDKTKNTPKD